MMVLTENAEFVETLPQIDPSTFNFTHVLKYFKDHVDPQTFVTARDRVDAMIDEGMSACEIREAMEHDQNCPRLFIEAILIGQAKQYVKTNAMIQAGVEPLAIYAHMTNEESGDTELVGAIIETETGYRIPGTTSTQCSYLLGDRDPRAYRAVSQLVSLDLAMKMKKVGVPEGGIRQKLARLGTSEEKIKDIMTQVRKEADESLRRRTSAESSKSPISVKNSESNDDEDEIFVDEFSDDDVSLGDEKLYVDNDENMRLQVAVNRRIKEMTQQGMAKAKIRSVLISMKGVNHLMVDSFLEET